MKKFRKSARSLLLALALLLSFGAVPALAGGGAPPSGTPGDPDGRWTIVAPAYGPVGVVLHGQLLAVDVPGRVVYPGRTMVPVRFIAETLGCTVSWDEATKTISIVHNAG